MIKVKRNYERHGMTGTLLYSSWKTMIRRCTNVNNPRYRDYGGRGITVCDRWRNSFLAFYEDMGDRPEGMTLEREDNDKGYCKDNCKWATLSEQQWNKRKPRNNTSGHQGVYWSKRHQKWVAEIMVNRKRIYLGEFVDIEDAVAARKEGEIKYRQLQIV